MNLLIIFDYIFYKIAWFYDKKLDQGESKKGAGIIFLSLIQMFNIVVVFDLLILKEKLIKDFPFYYSIIGCFILIGCNYFRYFVLLNFDKLEDKWGDEKQGAKITKGVFVIVYLILSFYLLDSNNIFFELLGRTK